LVHQILKLLLENSKKFGKGVGDKTLQWNMKMSESESKEESAAGPLSAESSFYGTSRHLVGTYYPNGIIVKLTARTRR
jgi:hypothetical protein